MAAGLSEASTRRPDLVILDLGLPDGDGIDFLRDLRGWSEVSVIVLSARVEEQDKIDALDAGANDYLTKPFGVGELLARVRAASRVRRGGEDNTPLGFRIRRHLHQYRLTDGPKGRRGDPTSHLSNTD